MEVLAVWSSRALFSSVVFVILFVYTRNLVGKANENGSTPCVKDKDGAWAVAFLNMTGPSTGPEALASVLTDEFTATNMKFSSKKKMMTGGTGTGMGAIENGALLHHHTKETPVVKSSYTGWATHGSGSGSGSNSGNEAYFTPHAVTCNVASMTTTLGQETTPMSYVANPFLVVHPSGARSFGVNSFEKLGISNTTPDGTVMFAFFEMKNSERGKGEIGVSFSPDRGMYWYNLGTVLWSAEHMSYPFVVFDQAGGDGNEDGEYIMLPQSDPIVSTGGNILGAQRAYVTKPSEFPFGWKQVAVKIRGKKLADASPIFWKGRWYIWITHLTNNPRTSSGFLELYMTEGRDLARSPWIKHPMSPVTADLRMNRMAGRPVVTSRGELLRPAQDCSGQHGRSVHWMHVTELSPTTYNETFSLSSPSLIAHQWPLPVTNGSESRNSKAAAWGESMLSGPKGRIHHIDLQELPNLPNSNPHSNSHYHNSSSNNSHSTSSTMWYAVMDGENFGGVGGVAKTTLNTNTIDENNMMLVYVIIISSLLAVLSLLVVEVLLRRMKICAIGIQKIILNEKDASSTVLPLAASAFRTNEDGDVPLFSDDSSISSSNMLVSLLENVSKSCGAITDIIWNSFVNGPGVLFISRLSDTYVKSWLLAFLAFLDFVGTLIVVSVSCAWIVYQLQAYLPGYPLAGKMFINDDMPYYDKPANREAAQLLSSPPLHKMKIRLNIITAASDNYYGRLLNLIGSVHVFQSDAMIHVYNIGFTEQQRRELVCMKNVVLHDFNFREHPAHVLKLGNYAWKLLIMRDHMQKLHDEVTLDNKKNDKSSQGLGTPLTQQQKDAHSSTPPNTDVDAETAAILWIDSGLEVRSPIIEETKRVMEQNHGHLCAWQGLCRNDLNGANPWINKILGDEDTFYTGREWSAGGLQGFVHNSDAHNLILKPAIECAMKAECIENMYSWDQGIFTRLIHKRGFVCQRKDEYLGHLQWKLTRNPLTSHPFVKFQARRHRYPYAYKAHVQWNATCDIIPEQNNIFEGTSGIKERLMADRIKGRGEMSDTFRRRSEDFASNVQRLDIQDAIGVVLSVDFAVLFSVALVLLTKLRRHLISGRFKRQHYSLYTGSKDVINKHQIRRDFFVHFFAKVYILACIVFVIAIYL
jgi:hypothetical protein